jgi:hypothetical protein
MMMDASSWLVREVSDLLETSSVGLYEFIWILRGKYPDVSEEELRSWAADALRGLLAEHRGRLVLLQWPSEDVVGSGSAQGLSNADWNDPVKGKPYVAITRN